MRFVSVVALASALFVTSMAQAAQTLATLDLSKNFQDTTINLANDQTYANGAVILVPPATSTDDQYMVSIQQNADAQCTTSGVMAKKTGDATLNYYIVVHVLALPTNSGHCFIGIHIRNKEATKRVFVDLFSQQGS